ncbi:MAG: ParB N-terminal domain-containing protein, partial [bacterium]|nr:ParB N-terminal domain-containing protein [bacterium]
MSQPYQVMPVLAEEEYQALKSSISEFGVLVPVEEDEAGHILDGHHRVQACRELGIENYPKLIRCGLGEDEKRAHARSLNLNRRHMKKPARDKLIAEQIIDTPCLSDRAIAARFGIDHKTVGVRRKRMISRGEIPHVETMVDSLGREQKRGKAATYIDNSPDGRSATIKRAKQIRTENSAVSRARRMENLQQIADKGRAGGKAMPVAAFPIGYVDVPWENKVWSEETGSAKNPPYPCMSVEETCELCAGENSPFTDAAVLFFWR